jgi:hypothetical protein
MLFLLAVVALLWVLNLLIVPNIFPTLATDGQPTSRPITNPGIFGDMFGGLNALFSGFSIVLVAGALVLQAVESRRQLERIAIEQRRQDADQLTLSHVLAETTRIQSQVAEALAQLAAATQTKNAADRIEFLLDYKTRRISALEHSRPRMITINSPEARRNAEISREIATLQQDVENLRRQLAGLDQ